MSSMPIGKGGGVWRIGDSSIEEALMRQMVPPIWTSNSSHNYSGSPGIHPSAIDDWRMSLSKGANWPQKLIKKEEGVPSEQEALDASRLQSCFRTPPLPIDKTDQSVYQALLQNHSKIHPQVWKSNTGQNYPVPHEMYAAMQTTPNFFTAYLQDRNYGGSPSPDYNTNGRNHSAYYTLQHGLPHAPTDLSYPDPAMSAVYFPKKRGRKPLAEKGKKRRKRNRPGSHVKRAKTAYFFFLEVFRKNYVKEGDQIPRASEITKACGAKWGTMTPEEKKPHVDNALEDRKRYESEMSMYRKVRDPDKPKKPPTAYFYFLTDFRARMKGKPIEKGRRLTEICGEEWNKLTEEQKRPYLDRVAVEYKKYQEAMEEWRKKKGMQAASTSVKKVSPSTSTSPPAAVGATPAATAAPSVSSHIPSSSVPQQASTPTPLPPPPPPPQAHQAMSPSPHTQMVPMGSHMAPMGAMAGGYNHAASMQQMQQMLLQQQQMQQAMAVSMARQQMEEYEEDEYEEDYEEEQ